MRRQRQRQRQPPPHKIKSFHNMPNGHWRECETFIDRKYKINYEMHFKRFYTRKEIGSSALCSFDEQQAGRQASATMTTASAEPIYATGFIFQIHHNEIKRRKKKKMQNRSFQSFISVVHTRSRAHQRPDTENQNDKLYYFSHLYRIK